MSVHHLWFCFLLLCSSQGQAAATAKVAEKDLAIAMPLESLELPAANLVLNSGSALFPETWYKVIDQAFQNTSVGTAISDESPYKTWQLVTLRIVPCAPLGLTPSDDVESICWPEIRLVWQPILRKIRLHERYMLAGADDRAVHAIYPIEANRILSPAEAARIENYHRLIKDYQRQSSAYAPLNSEQKADFSQLRNRLVKALMRDALDLRSSTQLESSYSQVGLRPEMLGYAKEQTTFIGGLHRLLNLYAQPKDLRTLTAFSLPEGREPAHTDEWVFLAFKGAAAKIQLDPMLIHSLRDGRVLADTGTAMRGSMTRDEPSLYDYLNGSIDAIELKKTVMFDVPDISRLAPSIQDRQQVLVPNTSCVSCHKLNSLRFDFHNFSYLEDRDLTISPRVVRDVELDLLWLKRHGA